MGGLDAESLDGDSDLGPFLQGGGRSLCDTGIDPMSPLGLPMSPLDIDAFAHLWLDLRLYAFPPVMLIPVVLCRVREC